jgi:hypothetical protein
MKKVVMLLLSVMIITSCQTTSHYQTRYQARILRNFDKPKHGKYTPERKRGDINHPAVRVETKKTLINH